MNLPISNSIILQVECNVSVEMLKTPEFKGQKQPFPVVKIIYKKMIS